MLRRSGLDAICKQLLFLRPFGVFGSQSTSCYSTKSSSFPAQPKKKHAYAWYLTDMLPAMKKEHPNLTINERFALAAKKWHNLDEKAKEKYNQAALKDKQQYSEALEKYNANLTPEMISAAAKQSAAKNHQKKLLRALGMPKRPMNAYLLFVNDQARKYVAENVMNVEKAQRFKEVSKLNASDWASLPDSEKAKWIELAAVNLKKYREDLIQWEAQMLATGHIEAIHLRGKK